MKVRLTIEVDELERQAIAHAMGNKGKARRGEVVWFMRDKLHATFAIACRAFANDPDVRRRRARKLHALPPDLGMKHKQPVAL